MKTTASTTRDVPAPRPQVIRETRDKLGRIMLRFNDLEAFAAGATALIAPWLPADRCVASAARIVTQATAATEAARDRSEALSIDQDAGRLARALPELADDLDTAGALFTAARDLLCAAKDHDTREGLPLLYAGTLLDQAHELADTMAGFLRDRAAILAPVQVAA